MNILITNDDGIDAEGLNSLYDVLSRKYNAYVIAPLHQQSASSNAITVRNHIDVQNIDEYRYAINGYTADCVSIGLKGGILPEIDLVISGINHGPNIGDDIFFSGTVAGARTAFIFGVSGIAISMDCSGNSKYFSDAANFLMDFISGFKDLSKVFLNINYPDRPDSEISGIKYTTLGRRKYNDSYKLLKEEGKNSSLQYDCTIESRGHDGTDVTELKKGYVSITPITLDCTDYDFLNKM